MKKMITLAIAGSLLSACGLPEATTGSGAALLSADAGITGPGPTCVAATPATCMMAKNQEEPPEPPPNYVLTACTYQVILQEVTISEGQGISESKLEVSIESSAGAGDVTWPTGDPQKMAKDSPKIADTLIATHTVARGQKKVIDICADFTEVDDGVINGDSDVGSACQQITLECNRRALREPPRTVTLADDLCRGGKTDEKGACKNYNGEVSADYLVTLSDRDWDGVPADQDFTPNPEDEACRGQEGRGVVLFSYYGSNNINEIIGQMGMGLDEMVENYDFVAIAMNSVDVLGFTVREDTLTKADMHVEPTLEGLISALRAATSRGFDVSLYVAGHGTSNSGVMHFTSEDADEFIDELELDAAFQPSVSGTCGIPFRMAYGIPCYFAEGNDLWGRHGSHAAGGPRTVNFVPQRGNAFARGWNAGDTFAAAVASSPDPVVNGLNAAAINVVGGGLCAAQLFVPATPLPMNGCAQWYFTGGGGTSVNFNNSGNSDYDPNISGFANMMRGSQTITAGNVGITKFTPLTW